MNQFFRRILDEPLRWKLEKMEYFSTVSDFFQVSKVEKNDEKL